MSSVRLSVHVYVTLVDCDRIGWNSSKIILPLISVRRSLSADQTSWIYSKGSNLKYEPKVTHPCWFERWRHSIANCGRMVTESATVTMESLEETTIALLNGTIADPYDLPFSQMGVPYAPWYASGHSSTTGDPIHFMFGSRVGFSGSADRMALFRVISNPRWRPAAILENFEYLCKVSCYPRHVMVLWYGFQGPNII